MPLLPLEAHGPGIVTHRALIGACYLRQQDAGNSTLAAQLRGQYVTNLPTATGKCVVWILDEVVKRFPSSYFCAEQCICLRVPLFQHEVEVMGCSFHNELWGDDYGSRRRGE